MKILLCHNYYRQPGGEDQSFAAEADLLSAHGHEVLKFTRHNDAIDGQSRFQAARNALWNREVYVELRSLIQAQRPDVMHCTNTFPLISPAAAAAAKAEGIPVVQSLRNYRIRCTNALLLREGKLCEKCLHKTFAWPGILHGCYKENRAASAVVAAVQWSDRLRQRWRPTVDLYFAPTSFARSKLIEGGIPADRIVVKPNFIDPDPGAGSGGGGYAAFVGRLSVEKGIDTLLRAWAQINAPVPLKIAGDGPLKSDVLAAARRDPRIEWLGHRSPEEILTLLGDATFLVMPSVYYETFGRTIIEAFARGTPVVASRLGAMSELVDDGRTGLLFKSGDPHDLAPRVRQMIAEPAMVAPMRKAARDEYSQKYTAEPNYRMLMAIYERAAALHHGAARERVTTSRRTTIENTLRSESPAGAVAGVPGVSTVDGRVT